MLTVCVCAGGACLCLQEAKKALKRCQVLSRPQELAQNALQLFDILANSLLVEHIDYGIELALQVGLTPPGGQNAQERSWRTATGISNDMAGCGSADSAHGRFPADFARFLHDPPPLFLTQFTGVAPTWALLTGPRQDVVDIPRHLRAVDQ